MSDSVIPKSSNDSVFPKSNAEGSQSLPHKFGKYVLFDFLGRGGMAEIYLARTTSDLGASRLVVVKQILPLYAGSERFAEMLIHEAKLAAELSHANIVQVFDLGRQTDQLFIAMEYVEGFDLHRLLRRCSREKVPLPLEFALHIITCTLRGLDYAHRRTAVDGTSLELVHRDVSPSNILVSFDGEVKLCDFGIAHAQDAMEARTSVVQGKACYMSPEHARGDAIDARADIFAIGIVFWELLSGRRLYSTRDGSKTALLDLAKEAVIAPPKSHGFAEEEMLYAIAMKALAFNPDDRYPTAAAMLRALEDYVAKTGQFASPLRFGDWLVERFGGEIVERRRSRERAAAAFARGPLVTLTPIRESIPDIPPPEPSGIAMLEPTVPRYLPLTITIIVALLAIIVFLLFWKH